MEGEMMAKKIRFKLVVKNDKEEWAERYCKPGITNLKKAEAWGRGTVEEFNRHLRECESPREFVRVELDEDQA